MRKISIMILLFVWAFKSIAQQNQTISPAEMEKIYQEVKTPYKYGLVMVPEDKDHKMDCPTVFKKVKIGT